MANGNSVAMMMMMMLMLAGGGMFLYMYMKRKPAEEIAPVTPTSRLYTPGTAAGGTGLLSESNIYYNIEEAELELDDDDGYDWDKDWDRIPDFRRTWWRSHYPGWDWNDWRREWKRRGRRHWWRTWPRPTWPIPTPTPSPYPFPWPHQTPPIHPDHWRLWHEHDWHWYGMYDRDRLRGIGFNDTDLSDFEYWLRRRKRAEGDIADWLEARLESIRDTQEQTENRHRWKFPWEE